MDSNVNFEGREARLDVVLNAVEARVLGSLIEKQVTTPEYYPLSLNALVNACNQLSNREPVVSYDEKTVARALEDLRAKQLIWLVSGASIRVPKYEQRLTDHLRLSEQETAVLCVLMLRGTQTPGEIRSRSGRLYDFQSLEEVDLTLESLMASEPKPLVAKLPRQPGTKEARFGHLLSGAIAIEEIVPAAKPEAAVLEVRAENERMVKLEEAIESIQRELAELKQRFAEFKSQFE